MLMIAPTMVGIAMSIIFKTTVLTTTSALISSYLIESVLVVLHYSVASVLSPIMRLSRLILRSSVIVLTAPSIIAKLVVLERYIILHPGVDP